MPAKPVLAIALLTLFCMAMPAQGATAANLETTITEGLPEGAAAEGDRVSFGFAATLDSEPLDGADFRCSVDDAPAALCASPFQTDQLAAGAHTFSVFAEAPDRQLADPTPAWRTFLVLSAEDECESFEDEESFEEEFEGETGECEGEQATGGPVPPEECLLRTARARLLTYSSQNKVRLLIRYTAFSQAEIFVDYHLSGGRGSLKLGSAHQHFGRRGLFRDTERLTPGEMERVRAARTVTVSMTVPEAPRYCRRYQTRRLTTRRGTRNRIVWRQAGSIFGS